MTSKIRKNKQHCKVFLEPKSYLLIFKNHHSLLPKWKSYLHNENYVGNHVSDKKTQVNLNKQWDNACFV